MSASRRSPAHNARLLRAHLAVGLLNFVQYRADFFIEIITRGFIAVSQLISLWIIFSQTRSLNGWSHEAMVLLIGVHMLCGGLLELVIRPSLTAHMEAVRQGTFDFVLTKPADSLLLACVQKVAPQALAGTLLGAGLIGFALTRLRETISPLQGAMFAVSLVAGLVMIHCFLIALTTLSFWLVKFDNIMVIFEGLYGVAGRWPVTIFPRWLRTILTFVVPVSFAVTVPSQALVTGIGWWTLAGSVGMATLFFISSRLFWRYALRHYTGASA